MVEGLVEPMTGFVMDHGKLETIVDEVTKLLDHRYLNDIEGMGLPTSENMCRWLWYKLKPRLPALVEINLRREKRGICVTYRGPQAGSAVK